MLITFKSRASSNVSYFQEIGKQILSLLGKDPEATKGVFTVEQLDAAITTLQEVMSTEKAVPSAHKNAEEDEDKAAEQVSLGRRVFPLLTLFERSKTVESPVMWGV